ncbi:DUF6327 family protein [Flagellimonas marinaquae]|uniref:Glutaminyl-tRNA synthetase n=2 Tax=Flagellimonas TaxID=444459 RepID=A0ABS7EN18_9FLAO|nr:MULTISPECIES: DUF6327 family protein [Allomuricauda]MAO16512.1 hypothetical protein [Allomuricauda sp.]MBO0352794.1 hypothetical protein [Allomuricauda aurea]MBW8198941.1 hypothetical protein [Allomuricauda abyssi]UBZ15824.1 DUF6327 family protein [Allomuricauda aquimarina]|tara:strand:- start:204 stop:419 length:216 start_codon:yes stop_codon:yes gene_type:complete
MIKAQYTSFEDIDRDLKILKLQRQIDEEQVKLAVQKTKEELYPTNILTGMAPLLQKLALTIVAKKLMNKFS